jgi:hypothetical protein
MASWSVTYGMTDEHRPTPAPAASSTGVGERGQRGAQPDLEPILDRFVAHGRTTTSFVHSAPVPPRPLPAGPLDQPPAE